MSAETKIIETITSLFKSVDERNWENVKRIMADTVLLDYSSMSGIPAANVHADDIINDWKGVLPGFDKTHHQLSDFSITIEDNIAQAHFSGKADHFLDNDVWTVAGTYDAALINTDNDWRVTKFRFNLQEQSGNKSLPSKAMEVVKQHEK